MKAGAQQGHAIQILMVEDNPGDVRLTQEALAEGKIKNQLHVVDDGNKAMAFLRGEAPYEGKAIPDLVLLDLNLPGESGHEVLTQMQSSRRLRNIPVIVLTTSTDERDVTDAYDLNADCYIAKPLDLEQFISVIRSIDDFWLSIVRLPPRPTP